MIKARIIKAMFFRLDCFIDSHDNYIREMLYRLDFAESRDNGGKENGEMRKINAELARQMRMLFLIISPR